jgi:hypothetical protein
MGRFQITQTQHSQHDGFDMVGLDSKEIHSTVNGTVVHAGWENPNNHSQGFGQYVCIKATDGNYYYFGHMSVVKASYGQAVKITDVIGIEGNTGYSFGSHCHYCCRPNFTVGNALDISSISGIPNALGIYDDGYRSGTTASSDAKADIKGLQTILNNAGAGLVVDGIVGEKTLAAVKKYSIELNDRGNLIKWVQERLTQLGFDAGYADGFAEKPTMDAIYSWQKANGLGVGNLYGSDWDVLLA